MANIPVVVLKPGRDKKIRSAYPWVQREEVARADPCEPGSIAELRHEGGEFLAVGTYNGRSRFPFRVFSLMQESIDTDWFLARMARCKLRRSSITGTNAMREVFSEADGTPGLIVDRYDKALVVQVRSAGMEALKEHWVPALERAYSPQGIYERSEMEGRREEGLEPFAGALFGAPPSVVSIDEDGLRFETPIIEGLKTGYYLDQRETRRRLAARVTSGDRVLDAFCYSGGFSLHAARAGADCVGVDILDIALQTARRNAALNRIESNCAFIEGNVFDYLSEPSEGPKFDWIVLDPPAIAKQRDKHDSLKWGIWKLVFHAIDHLNEGGRLIVCSCSYQLGLTEMLDTIRLAASDRGKLAFHEETTIQAPDHPYLLQFPESLYLKCAWVRIERA